MRDAILKGSADLAGVRPNKGKAGRKAASRAPRGGALAILLGKVRAHALATIVGSGFAIIMGGIVVNATAFQKGHHPAPLFGTAAPAPAPGAKRPASVASPAHASADTVVQAEPPAAQPAAAVASQPPVGPAFSTHLDGIGQMLRGQGKAAPVGRPDATATIDLKRPHTAARARTGPQVASGTDRNRLATMMSAASRQHGASVQAN